MRVNKNGYAQYVPPLTAGSPASNVKQLLTKYGLWDTYDHRDKMQYKYGVRMTVAVCIAKADTSLGRELKTTNNVANVGNNDRWDRVHYKTIEAGIEAVFRTLSNRYIGRNKKIWELSNWWRKVLWLPPCWNGNYCFATSSDNRNINLSNCLSEIYKKPIDENFLFRL